MELRPYQKEALEFAVKNKRSTVVMPTGSGKTTLALFFVKNLLIREKLHKS